MNSDRRTAADLAFQNASDEAIDALADMGFCKETALSADQLCLQSAGASYLKSLVDQDAEDLLVEAFIEYTPRQQLITFFQQWACVAAGYPIDHQELRGALEKGSESVARALIEQWASELPSDRHIEKDRYIDQLIDEAREVA